MRVSEAVESGARPNRNNPPATDTAVVDAKAAVLRDAQAEDARFINLVKVARSRGMSNERIAKGAVKYKLEAAAKRAGWDLD